MKHFYTAALSAMALLLTSDVAAQVVTDTAAVPAPELVAPRVPVGSTRGFSLGIHRTGSAWAMTEAEPDMDPEGGGGFGVQAAYGILEYLTVYTNLEFAAARFNDEAEPGLESGRGLGHFDLGLRVALGSPYGKWRFPLQAALSGFAAAWDVDEDRALAGGGLTLGAGVTYFAIPELAIYGGIDLTGGRLTEQQTGDVRTEIDEPFSATRFRIGASYFFGR